MSHEFSTKTDEPRLGPLRILFVSIGGAKLARLLTDDEAFEVLVVADLDEAARVAQQRRFDACTVAFGAPSAEDAAALEVFCRAHATIPTLVLSQDAPEHSVVAIIRAGASGYLLAEEASSLPSALREVARGGTAMSPVVSRVVIARARRNSGQFRAVAPPPAEPILVTTRQRQILELLAGGHSYDDIARALNLSVNTVRWHVKSLYARLGASSKVEAVLKALELQLIGADAATSQDKSIAPTGE
jgi:DNA-binding NarL/FixJ family response regulator